MGRLRTISRIIQHNCLLFLRLSIVQIVEDINQYQEWETKLLCLTSKDGEALITDIHF